MPKFLEAKLKQEYGADSSTPFKVMNKLGAMHGNKETPKGAAMQAKHERDEKALLAPKKTKVMAKLEQLKDPIER